MKPWTLTSSACLLLLFTVGASAAANRTTRIGQVDSVSDSSFIHLLDSAQPDAAITRPVLTRSADQFAGRAVPEAARLLPSVQPASLLKLTALPGQYLNSARFDVVAIPRGDDFESWLMLGLAAGLIALHLRRKQKSLQHRPLAEVMYR